MKQRFTLKTGLLSLLVLAFVGVGAYFGWQYYKTAPERVAANFINFIVKNGNDPAAYQLTTTDYQNTVPFNHFVNDFSPLDKSEVTYTNIGEKAVSGKVITGGLLNDVKGANYTYLMTLTHTGSKWQISAVYISKE